METNTISTSSPTHTHTHCTINYVSLRFLRILTKWTSDFLNALIARDVKAMVSHHPRFLQNLYGSQSYNFIERFQFDILTWWRNL